MGGVIIEDDGIWNDCVGKGVAGKDDGVRNKDERGVSGVTLSGTVGLGSTVLGGTWSRVACVCGGGGGGGGGNDRGPRSDCIIMTCATSDCGSKLVWDCWTECVRV